MEEFCQKCIEQSIRFLLLRLSFLLNYFLIHENKAFLVKICKAKANLGRNKTLDGNDLNTKEEKKKVGSTFQNMPSFARSGPTFCCFSI